ncbi:MAG: lysophospholipid acyltransferase family protein [Candidatus Schekmanbacteria bacterium]|nr:lysophospholipid acyltransferase family protein [Candidatus Schekmanbacteria bacterium]
MSAMSSAETNKTGEDRNPRRRRKRWLDFWIYLWRVQSRFCPRWYAQLWARAIGLLTFIVCRRYRRNVWRSYRIVAGPELPWWKLCLRTWRAFDNLCRGQCDFFLYAFGGGRDPAAVLGSVKGVQHLEPALAANKGLLLITAHVGAWELGAVLMRPYLPPDREIVVVYYKDVVASYESARSEARGLGGIKQVSVGSSMFAALPVLRALRQGSIAAVQGDRDYTGSSLEVPFFGRPALFSSGPVRLATAADVPIFPVFVLRGADGKYHAEVRPQLDLVRLPDREAETQENVRRWTAVLEEVIRRYPDQWYCFSPVWDFSGDR